MSPIAKELDRRLSEMGPAVAEQLERLVRDALALAEKSASTTTVWPAGYFEATAGALAGEVFDRPDQGETLKREDW